MLVPCMHQFLLVQQALDYYCTSEKSTDLAPGRCSFTLFYYPEYNNQFCYCITKIVAVRLLQSICSVQCATESLDIHAACVNGILQQQCTTALRNGRGDFYCSSCVLLVHLASTNETENDGGYRYKYLCTKMGTWGVKASCIENFEA